VDSTRTRVAPPAEVQDQGSDAVSPRLAVRIGQSLPLLRRAESGARRVAGVSAASAVVLALALEWPAIVSGTLDWPVVIAGLAVLLAPAGLTWLGVGALRELLTLPSRLRTGAAEAAERARAVVAETAPRGTRIGSFIRALWAGRSLAAEVRRGALSLGTAARLFRLTRLPLVLLMAAGFALNFVVILAAVAAVVFRLIAGA
jgi:hypothetical protein